MTGVNSMRTLKQTYSYSELLDLAVAAINDNIPLDYIRAN